MSTEVSKMLAVMASLLALGGAVLLQVQHTRGGVAHDLVRNATVAGADCLRRIACDDPDRFGGASRGELSGARGDAIRDCAKPFLKLLENGEQAEISIEPQRIMEGDEATVRVRLAFPCSVPFAGGVACGPSRALPLGHEERVTVTGCDQRD